MEDFIYDVYNDDKWWWSVGRRALVRRLCKKYSRKQGLYILDIGCGTGSTIKETQLLGPSYGIDVSPEAVKYCRERGVDSVCVADASALPYRDERFDIIISVDVLEHVDDDVGSLEEIYRVCRPGAILILTVPAFRFLWSRRDEFAHHKRRYTLKEMREKLSVAGFQIIRATYINLPLLIPLFLLAKVGRLLSPKPTVKMEYVIVPSPINKVLGWVISGEAGWLVNFDLPIGTSIGCVAKKASEASREYRPGFRDTEDQ